MFSPRLIPETTMSGSSSSSPVTAICTQSVGVPLTNRNPFGDLRMRFDAHESGVESGTMFLEMLARAGPFRDDGGVDVERAELFAAKVRAGREDIGEHLPMLVQPRARASADAVLGGVVVVGIGAPTLGEIDHADRGVTVGRDEHHAAHSLRARRRIARQQAAIGM